MECFSPISKSLFLVGVYLRTWEKMRKEVAVVMVCSITLGTPCHSFTACTLHAARCLRSPGLGGRCPYVSHGKSKSYQLQTRGLCFADTDKSIPQERQVEIRPATEDDLFAIQLCNKECTPQEAYQLKYYQEHLQQWPTVFTRAIVKFNKNSSMLCSMFWSSFQHICMHTLELRKALT
jgi:hypothetical protein